MSFPHICPNPLPCTCKFSSPQSIERRIESAISWEKLPWGGQDKFVQLDANASHAVAKLLEPVIEQVRAEAQAEALREAASELEQLDEIDGKGSYRAGPDNCANWLRARADKLVTDA